MSGALGALVLAALALGCDRAPAKHAYPSGTVLALSGTPILAADVDEICGWFALLEPLDSTLQLRRLALTNVIFPRIAAQNADPKLRAEALARAHAWREAIVAGTLPNGPLAGPMEQERTGIMLDLGMEVWNAGLTLPIGAWSDVIETAGCFHVLKVKQHVTTATPGTDKLTLAIFDFPYLDAANAAKSINAEIDRATLEFVDENWREAVPTAWQYRMRGGNP